MNNQLQQVELAIDDAKRNMALMHALNRLATNPDFNLVFNEHYFTEEPIRLVMFKADDTQQSDKDQAKITAQMDAIGYLRSHLQYLTIMGRRSEQAIQEDQKTRDEILEEEAAA